jgi:hypothetical protein
MLSKEHVRKITGRKIGKPRATYFWSSPVCCGFDPAAGFLKGIAAVWLAQPEHKSLVFRPTIGMGEPVMRFGTM